MAISVIATNLRDQIARRSFMINAGGWVVGVFIFSQVMRLGTSIGLAYLLAPELLGLMALINTLQTGGALLSDIGVGHSVVQNRDGDKPRFYNTAWTMGIARGVLLFVAMLIATVPIANVYNEPLLLALLPVSAFVFIIGGFNSPAIYLLQRRIRTKRIAIFSVVQGVFSAIVHLGLAWYLQSIWALVIALLVSSAFVAFSSLFMLDWRMHRLCWDRAAVRAIFGFGKWVFLSTLIFFLASSFDRLYLAEAVSFAALGVYGIARTFADTAMSLTQTLSSQLLFPKVSGSPLRGYELRAAIYPVRKMVVLALAGLMGCGIVVADVFILLIYDQRYADAALFLPILLAGGWFAMLAAFSESMLMGIGKPSNVAMGNGLKLVALVGLVPVTLAAFGMTGAVMVFSAVEFVRYAVLSLRTRTHRLSFWRQDLLATVVFVVIAVCLREITGLLGLTSGVEGWIAMTRSGLGI